MRKFWAWDLVQPWWDKCRAKEEFLKRDEGQRGMELIVEIKWKLKKKKKNPFEVSPYVYQRLFALRRRPHRPRARSCRSRRCSWLGSRTCRRSSAWTRCDGTRGVLQEQVSVHINLPSTQIALPLENEDYVKFQVLVGQSFIFFPLKFLKITPWWPSAYVCGVCNAICILNQNSS